MLGGFLSLWMPSQRRVLLSLLTGSHKERLYLLEVFAKNVHYHGIFSCFAPKAYQRGLKQKRWKVGLWDSCATGEDHGLVFCFLADDSLVFCRATFKGIKERVWKKL